MNILFVQAYLGGSESPVFPLGLSSLAASFKGCKFKLFDPNVSPDPYNEFVRLLRSFSPDILGISLRNIDSTNKREVVFYYSYFKEMIDIVRDVADKDCKIIIGGSGFSMFARDIMEDEPEIDYGIFLEGEKTFPELLENLDKTEKVKGVYYRKNGKVIFSGLREQMEMASVALPDRTMLDTGLYANASDSIGVETKRGCAFNCIYCIYGFLNGKKLRLRPPEMVVDDIEVLSSNLRVGNFTFVDAVFNTPISHAEAICKEIIRRKLNVSWSAWFLEDYMTEEFIQLAVNAGCNKFILSPDGFSDKTLALLGKSFKRKEILRVFDILKNIEGIEICYNFFKNPPGQDLSTFFNLMSFYFGAKRQLSNRVHFEFNSIRIEPHTKLYDLSIKEGLINKDDSLLYPKYYTKKDTVYIEKLFNLMLRIKGK